MHLLDEECLTILELWRAYRGDGMGAGYLPFSGGYGEQPAGLMAAFEACSGMEARIRSSEKEAKKGRT